MGIFCIFALNYFQDYGGNLMEQQSPGGQCSYNCNGWPYQQCRVGLSIDSEKEFEEELAVKAAHTSDKGHATYSRVSNPPVSFESLLR